MPTGVLYINIFTFISYTKGGVIMKKTKTICYILVACLIANLGIPALATNITGTVLQATTDHKTHIDNSLITKYESYELDIPKMYADEIQDESEDETNYVPLLEILKNTEVLEEYVLIDTDVTLYDGTIFKNYLLDVNEMIEVSKIGTTIYVQYSTIFGEEIILAYREDGMIAYKFIGNRKKDIAIEIKDGQALVYEDFWTAGQVELSKETSEAIDIAIANDYMQALENIPGIYVTYAEDGSVMTSIADNNAYSSRYTKTNFVPPQRQFPEYTKRQVSRQSRYVSALKRNNDVTVKQSMNSYKETRADKYPFYAGSTLAVIGGFLGGTAITVGNILAGIGVAMSGLEYIKESVTLYKSTSYDYIGAKEG